MTATHRDHIDGVWSEPSVELDGWLEDPNTGERVGPQRASTPEAVEAALAAADRNHRTGAWAGLPVDERLARLGAMSEHLAGRMAEAATVESSQNGTVVAMTNMLAVILPGAFQLAAAQLASGWNDQVVTSGAGKPVEVRRPPWGPAVLLAAWNAPAPMAAHKAASALAAGCPVIIKPPELCPTATTFLADAAEAAGLPAGTVQIVNGGPSVGGTLVTDTRTRAVSFTGGTKAGREIAMACASDFKPAQLELGGNNAMVVLADADVEVTADGVVSLLTSLNGQWCRALGRLIVPETMVDDLLDAVGARLAKLAIGPSTSPDSQMGPIVHSRHLGVLRERIGALVSAGGAAHSWSDVPDGPGNWLAPTLVTGVDPAHTVEEIFGPVAAVHTYAANNIDTAVEIANGTPYGLEGYVFGTDEDAALAVARRVIAGEVKVNGASVLSLDLMTPRPAWGWSGFDIEGTAETFQFFCGTHVVGVEAPFPG